MKLTVKLTASRRSEIEGIVSEADALIVRRIGLLEQSNAALRSEKDIAEEIDTLEEKANSGDRDASRELLSARDQQQRNNITIERLGSEIEGDLREEMNQVSARAHEYIKQLLTEARDELVEKLFVALAPYFFRVHEVRPRIYQFEALQLINIFITNTAAVKWDHLTDAAAHLLEYRQKLTVLLSPAAIIREWEGCDIARK